MLGIWQNVELDSGTMWDCGLWSWGRWWRCGSGSWRTGAGWTQDCLGPSLGSSRTVLLWTWTMYCSLFYKAATLWNKIPTNPSVYHSKICLYMYTHTNIYASNSINKISLLWEIPNILKKAIKYNHPHVPNRHLTANTVSSLFLLAPPWLPCPFEVNTRCVTIRYTFFKYESKNPCESTRRGWWFHCQ